MSIAVRCPRCRRAFAIPEKHAGKKGRCPECKTVFLTPENSGKAPPISTSSATPPPLPLLSNQDTPSTVPQTGMPSDRKQYAPSHDAPKSAADYARRRAPVGFWVGVTAAVFLLLTGGAWAVWWNRQQQGSSDLAEKLRSAPKVASSNPSVDAKTETLQRDRSNSTSSPVVPSFAPPDEPSVLTAEEHRAIEAAAPFVVVVECATPSGIRRGKGFLVDTRGWVATSFHLTGQASSAQVQFAGGKVRRGGEVPAQGTVAVSRQHDLALIKLGPPGSPGFTEPQFAASTSPAPDSAAAVLKVTESAEKFPTGKIQVRACRIQRVAPGDQLPAAVRSAARQRGIEDSAEITWIEHSSRVSQQDSGAPLLNPQGEIVGVNTWLGDTLDAGYAIHVKHLASLKALANDDEVTSFSTENAMAANEPQPNLDADSGVGDPSADGVDSEKKGMLLEPFSTFPVSAEVIRQLQAQCKANHWTANDLAQYRPLQKLAYAVTTALDNADANNPPVEHWRLAAEAARQCMEELTQLPWPKMRPMGKFDEIAARALNRDEGPLFAYVRVDTPAGEIANNDKDTVVIMELVGANQLIVVPVSQNIAELTNDSHWILMGMARSRSQITTREGDKLDAIGIHCKMLIGQPGK